MQNANQQLVESTEKKITFPENCGPPSRLKIYIPSSGGKWANPHPTDSKLLNEIDQASRLLRGFAFGATKKNNSPDANQQLVEFTEKMHVQKIAACQAV